MRSRAMVETFALVMRRSGVQIPEAAPIEKCRSALIATLAVNALLLGGIAAYSHNTGRSATDNLSSFAIDKTLGIPNTVFVALTFIVAFWFILSRTTGGWRFTAVSTSAQAGQAAGLRVDRYTVTTYVLAAMCFATAGILLAGYVRTPALDIGNPYLLATITAVVIGGTPLGGGRGSVIGTALAALFLTQLTAFTDALGAPPRYLVPGHRVVAPGCWDRHDLFPLSLMIRGVLSPVPAVSVDR